MKNRFQKVLAVVLCVMLCFSLVGCGKKAEDTTGTDTGSADTSASSDDAATTDTAATPTTAADPYAEPMEISIALWGIGDMITDQSDAVLDTIQKKFNITIVPYAVTWGDYTEKIKLWAASGSLPDVTAYEAGFTSYFDDWTEQGVVRALPSDMSKYPNIQKLLESDYGQSVNKILPSTTDKVYYAVPRPTYADATSTLLDYGVCLRKDWMEKVGVTAVPENIDDLIALLQKFQTEDPDGNGIADTIGLTGYNYAWMTSLFTGTCPGAINGFRWVYAEDGSIEPVWKNASFLEGVKALKKVYDAGVLDPDYIIIKGEEGRDKFKNGKAGAYAHAGADLTELQQFEQSFKESTPDKTIDQLVTFMPLFANAEGKVEYPQANTSWSESYLSANVSDAKAERCMALIDYLLSDEGYKLTSIGIEGVDYTEDANGAITLIDTLNDDGTVKTVDQKYPAAGLRVLANWNSYRSASSPAYSDTIKKISKDYYDTQISRGAVKANLPDTNGLVLKDSATYDTAGNDFQKVINDLMTADDIDTAWKNMVDSFMASGYDKVIAEMNELYKASGRQ